VRGAAREKERGSGRCRVGAGEGAERGPGTVVGSAERPAVAPTIRRGRRCCCMTEEGGRARARAADKRDRATAGPGGQRLGAELSERERGSMARGVGSPGSTVPTDRVLNPIQTESNYSKWFKRIQNCPSFGRLKSAFTCSKNGK
jgi:hypothetical protein